MTLPGNIKDFVEHLGGHSQISKILIANNGIAAVKEIRSIRKWSYEMFGNERAISFTVMATPEDLEANAEYIRIADDYIEVAGGSNNNNFANVNLIADIAERCGADAVWAGWGHASENPKLPLRLAKCERKVIFIGPPAHAMRSLGDKISSTLIAQSAEVPTVDWSGSGLTLDEDDSVSETSADALFVQVSDHLFQKACVSDAQAGLECAKIIGFPVMIKCSEGGGGKGIRKVYAEKDFVAAFEQCKHEVVGSPVFIMKLLDRVRHLEVQILADQYGSSMSLFGRDCSVQRRHQKIIEEAPISVADKDVLEALEQAAVRLAKMVGYFSAGTVEYLYDPSTKRFYFLELNPRLQVEHPCTEMVSGVNLPAAQLQIAMGIPLYRIKDIRMLYGLSPYGTTEIDFEFNRPNTGNILRKPTPKGHVISARITAENPDAGFKPNSGTVDELTFRSSSNAWGYFSVSGSGGLHEFADSQFGHLFAYGETREDARKHLVMALKELSIRSEFRTTVEYLVTLLEKPDFRNNSFDTAWLDKLISTNVKSELPDPSIAVICYAATKSAQMAADRTSKSLESLARSQIPDSSSHQLEDKLTFAYNNFRFNLIVSKLGLDYYRILLNGSSVDAKARILNDGGCLVSISGKSFACYCREEVYGDRLIIDGKTCIYEKEQDPSQLLSPSTGKLIKFHVKDGQHIETGQVYAEIEVMKMCMSLSTAHSGHVKILKQEGAVLSSGDVLAILELDDPSQVRQVSLYQNQLSVTQNSPVTKDRPDQIFKRMLKRLWWIMEGYEPVDSFKHLVDSISTLLTDDFENIARNEIMDVYSTISERLPETLDVSIGQLLDKTFSLEEMIVSIFQSIVSYREDLKLVETTRFDSIVKPLIDTLEAYKQGGPTYRRKILCGFLEKFYDYEIYFDKIGNIFQAKEESSTLEGVVIKLSELFASDLEQVLVMLRSHLRLLSKCQLIIEILNILNQEFASDLQLPNYIESALRKIASLTNSKVAKCALVAREILVSSHVPSFEDRTRFIESKLSKGNYNDGLLILVESNYTIFDVLVPFFFHKNSSIMSNAIETYVRRAYQIFSIDKLIFENNCLTWDFNWKSNTDPQMRQILVSTSPVTAHSTGEINENGQFTNYGTGFFFVTENFDSVDSILKEITELKISHDTEKNCIMIAVKMDEFVTDNETSSRFSNLIISNPALFDSPIRRFTFVVLTKFGIYPKYYTFRKKMNAEPAYVEDKLIRNIEPSMTYQLELDRFKNFEIKAMTNVESQNMHVYLARSKEVESDQRFFMRILIRPKMLKQKSSKESLADYLITECDKHLQDALSTLHIWTSKHPQTDCNHLFVNLIPYLEGIEEREVCEAIPLFLMRYGRKLWKLRITEGEVRVSIRPLLDEPSRTLRFFLRTTSGHSVSIEGYSEVSSDGKFVLESLSPTEPGIYHGLPSDFPYESKEEVQPKRLKAHLMGTTYVYDFPDLFQQGLCKLWAAHGLSEKDSKQSFVKVKEFVLSSDKSTVSLVDRTVGMNSIGMVAWLVTLYTPEFPKSVGGREIVVIANDITFQIGSFGPDEDMLFLRSSEYARRNGIPRIYISANSGARIGLAEELMSVYKVAWKNQNDPKEGYKYLYIDEIDYQALQNKSSQPVVNATKITDDGETRYKIDDIIGSKHGIGVENLQGSGLIAGETSRAYKEIFTISLVTCRSVGIGAYLVRLGQRVVQVTGHPIILTGSAALNKLLGREVYSSNLQLGGTQIMHANGVSHLTAIDDFDGILQILKWLSFVPGQISDHFVLLQSQNADPIDRRVTFIPTKNPYDPRHLITGCKGSNGEWLSGLFDRDSFFETLSGWARSVVTGRARLGGIAVGVIVSETRITEKIVPADPADHQSQKQKSIQPGQVWTPNSAYKTAQAINDFNHGERLPLIILANWRGFSGGMMDMYNEVLKYGSMIVDALAEYKQPVIIYIPPLAELRGGAWVVLDPSINAEMMEIYADSSARGGILEPEGIVEIKYRKNHLQALMLRLDTEYHALTDRLKSLTKDSEEFYRTKKLLEEREALLYPIYSQIALQFADLHDTPGRMKAKEAINGIVDWADSRQFLYYRLHRRLYEESIRLQMTEMIFERALRAGESAADFCSLKQTRTFMQTRIQQAGYSIENDSDKVICDIYEKVFTN